MDHKEYTTLARAQTSHFWFRTLYNFIISALCLESKLQSKSLSVFDAGAGCGGLMSKLHSVTCVRTIQGCEPYYWAWSLCRENSLKVINSSIEKLTINEAFDVVTCIDVLVLEGVDIQCAISRLIDLTVDGGLIIFNLAAYPLLRRHHDVKCGCARRFTYKSFLKELPNDNLLTVNFFYWNIFLSPVILIQALFYRTGFKLPTFIHRYQSPSDLEPPPALINSLLFLILSAEKYFPVFMRRLFGTSLFIIFRKTSGHLE